MRQPGDIRILEMNLELSSLERVKCARRLVGKLLDELLVFFNLMHHALKLLLWGIALKEELLNERLCLLDDGELRVIFKCHPFEGYQRLSKEDEGRSDAHLVFHGDGDEVFHHRTYLLLPKLHVL